ncbi:MAG TPA: prepilin-type N-terminal cleavage/methylation domain-containing protein [bacterium]|nr:prepilin-type N-terminal cleavage/methylation domain-containing protein [bacterium]
MKKQAGFTVIEIITALVIFVVGFIGSAGFFYANRHNLAVANRQRLSYWSALEKLEWLKEQAYADLADSTELVQLNRALEATRSVVVEEINENGALYKRITVTVERGEERVQLVTYAADI